MEAVVVVFIGAGIGGVIRHFVNVAAARAFGIDFPWGIAIINMSGSFLMGALTAWLAFGADASWTPDRAALRGDRHSRRLHDLLHLLA